MGSTQVLDFFQSAKLCVISITVEVDSTVVEKVTGCGGCGGGQRLSQRTEVMSDRGTLAVGREKLTVAVIIIETEEERALRWYGGDQVDR